jgi:hypothetical protein
VHVAALSRSIPAEASCCAPITSACSWLTWHTESLETGDPETPAATHLEGARNQNAMRRRALFDQLIDCGTRRAASLAGGVFERTRRATASLRALQLQACAWAASRNADVEVLRLRNEKTMIGHRA